MENKVTIKISRELYQRLSQMIEDAGFSSVTEFTALTMRTLTSGGEGKWGNRLIAEEVRSIRDRFNKVGYLKEKNGKARRKRSRVFARRPL